MQKNTYFLGNSKNLEKVQNTSLNEDEDQVGQYQSSLKNNDEGKSKKKHHGRYIVSIVIIIVSLSIVIIGVQNWIHKSKQMRSTTGKEEKVFAVQNKESYHQSQQKIIQQSKIQTKYIEKKEIYSKEIQAKQIPKMKAETNQIEKKETEIKETEIKETKINKKKSKQSQINENIKNDKMKHQQNSQITPKKEDMSTQQKKPLTIEVETNSPQQLRKQQIIKQNERKKQQALQKYYTNGLKEYYQGIQQQIKIVKIFSQDSARTQKWTYLINNVIHNTTDLCKAQIKKNHESGMEKQINQLICLIHVNSKTDDLLQLCKEFRLEITTIEQILTSNYQFINKHISHETEWIIFSKHLIDNPKTELIRDKDNLKLAYLLVSKPTSQIKQSVTENIDISQQQIGQLLTNSQLIFRKQVVNIITPLNFAFQDIYSLDELLTYPILGVAQLANKLKVIHVTPNNSSTGEPNKNALVNANQTNFRFSQLQAKANPHLCFLASPSNLSNNSQEQMLNYLSAFQKSNDNTKKTNSSLSILISIIYQPTQSVAKAVQQIIEFSNSLTDVRILIQYKQVSPPLQAYQAAYGYCPQKSIMFSSRMNIRPLLPNLLEAVAQTKICSNHKTWILVGNYIQVEGKKKSLSGINEFGSQSYLKSFDNHFFHSQIYCQQLMREIRLEYVKWDELQFHQTQASFIKPMIERVRKTNIGIVKTQLYKVDKSRIKTNKQVKQIGGLNLRNKGKASANPLKPLQYSELNNHAFIRNPPQVIPRIIHQILLTSQKQISPIRKALADTLIKTNPTFEYKFWLWENVTREQFPITFDGILKFQEVEKETGRNFKALMADLMRIQLLYQYGGIYLDYKTEGKKSLIPFLKYEDFYLRANEQVLYNGVIGSRKGNRHLYTVLSDYFHPSNLRAPRKQIYEMTGGSKLVQAYTKKQLYTETMNLEQFILEGQRPCVLINSNQPLQEGQQVFTGLSNLNGNPRTYRVYVPCKKDMEKYMELYDIIGRSYLPKNKNSY